MQIYKPGSLRASVIERNGRHAYLTAKLDSVLTHKLWSFPVFLGIVFLMFYLTFVLGNHPVKWVEQLFAWTSWMVDTRFAQGPVHDLMVNGIIPGIGGVAVFLPNIIILFLLISFLEDSGYMARTAYIVDKLMRRIGLDGQSFVPLVIGFGCNVPAIMATRSIEDKRRRLVTMLIIPFMSCSARLPIYVLFISAFFTSYKSLILFLLYLTGIFLAGLSAWMFSNAIRRNSESPFVLELHPYRLPSLRSVLGHMWTKSLYFIKKMGGVILVASIIIWALGYFPLERNRADRYEDTNLKTDIRESVSGNEGLENSYIGMMGKGLLPIFEPLGFDWKMSVSIITGLPAKEIIVSSLAVLNNGNEGIHLTGSASSWNPGSGLSYPALSALSFMVFVLISFPCVGTLISIRKESGSILWMAISFLYNTTAAWILSFLVYQTGSLLI